MPVPGVPVSPGDQVTKNANDKIASAVDDLFDAIDKATQCSFGRAVLRMIQIRKRNPTLPVT